MRVIVSCADWVCSVAKTRWPVSAAVSATEIVSRSRISPTRITSGSWRSTCLSAVRKPWVSCPTSRWLTRHPRCSWRNSIGSSMVMMCPRRLRLILSIIAASVVDLPEPVGPVTSTRPRLRSVKLSITSGMPSDSRDLISHGIIRMHGAERLALLEDVDAEPGVTGDRVREVELEVLLERLPLALGHHAVQRGLQLLGGQRGVTREDLHLAADPDGGRGAEGQVEVGATGLEDVHEQVVEHEAGGALVRRASGGRGRGSLRGGLRGRRHPGGGQGRGDGRRSRRGQRTPELRRPGGPAAGRTPGPPGSATGRAWVPRPGVPHGCRREGARTRGPGTGRRRGSRRVPSVEVGRRDAAV